MQELRWILLLVGVLFLIVLAAWETLRARRSVARRELFPHLDRELPREPAPGSPLDSQRDPQPDPHLDGAAAEPIRAQRRGPPLIELPQVSAVHVEVTGSAFSSAPEPAALEEPVALEPAVEEPTVEEPATSEPAIAEAAIAEAAAAPAMPAAESLAESTAESLEGSAAESTATQPVDSTEPAPADIRAMPQREPTAAPRVDWPPDGERQILSIRIVSAGEQRLSGRSVRQALAASGFVHGRYHIFHQAAEDGRVLLSCASLNKPGNFDPAAMDFQRYSGLSIFAVLPGPLPAQAALERLLTAGRDVSQRLQALLLDERGEPLDSVRIATLRASVAAAAGMSGAGPAAGATGATGAAGAAGRTIAASAVGGEPRA